jgi:3-carboxy-cis,cis-muconate cycloisomerase
MLEGLTVDEDRMRRNLAASNGLIVAEAVMMELAPHIGRQKAHDVVYDACRTVYEKGGTLGDALAADTAVTAHIDRETIDRITDPVNYLGHSVKMVEQAVGAFARDLP